MENYNVTSYRAVATSALRDAKNSKEIIAKLYQDTEIKLEVISGEEEAKLVTKAIAKKVNLDQGKNLLIDIGGGSIELITLIEGEMIKKESFPLGTVRLLQLHKESGTKDLKKWLVPHLKEALFDFFNNIPPLPLAVGTGGNMDRFIKLKEFVATHGGEYLDKKEMKKLENKLTEVNYQGRMDAFDLRPDRADVIVPAAIATNTILELASSERIHLPQVGLRDGVLYELCSSS